MPADKHLIIYTDGGARGNPGPAAVGVVIKNNSGKEIEAFGRVIGHATNNQAEYQALFEALGKAAELKAEVVDCYLDSELVVKQMKGEYKVKDQTLRVKRIKIQELILKFKKVSFHHVLRHLNARADSLVNQVLDKDQDR